MAFSTIAASDVDADSPITDTLMNTIRTNFDDHETRIGAAYQAGAVAIRITQVSETTPVDTFNTRASFLVWCPAGITKLKMLGRFTSFGSGTKIRLYIAASSTAGVEYVVSGATNPWTDADFEISPAAGDKGGWMLVELQLYAPSGKTIDFHKDEETIGGILQDFAGSSYWE